MRDLPSPVVDKKRGDQMATFVKEKGTRGVEDGEE